MPEDDTAVRYHLFLQWLTARSFAAAQAAARDAGMRVGLILNFNSHLLKDGIKRMIL